MRDRPGIGATWVPPADDELTWFLADDTPLGRPGPLVYTLEVAAFVFGMTRALESLEFPLTDVRYRLIDGRLYLAIVPSAQAERDLKRRLESVRDLSFRFTRNIRASWQQQVQAKVEGYNRWMAEFVSASGSAEELAEHVRQLRRMRGNQWFNVIRPVVAPAALIQRRAEETAMRILADAAQENAHEMIRRARESGWDGIFNAIDQSGRDSAEVRSLVRAGDDGVAVTREALGIVGRGREVLRSALQEVGLRLTGGGSIQNPDDIFWLEWMEVRDTLRHGGSRRDIVVKRREEASRPGRADAPPIIGPPLPADAPRMYLIREILHLLR